MQEFIKKHKNEYMEINKVFCPYLGDYVYFTMIGFKHLIKNKDGKRNQKTIYSRLNSIKHIKEIISKSGTLQEYENINTEYFGFISILKSNKYKVIILKDKIGKYKFISIVPNYRTNKMRDKYLFNKSKIYPKNE